MSFRFVADIDVGFVRGFVSEQFVVIRFVRPDGNVQRRIQIHPRHVALVIVVGEEGIGASGQESLERGVIRERGRFP